MYKEKEHESSGITLIALVVTIIILIILATITLRGVFGEGGLIQEAKGMKQNTDKEIANSEEELSQSEQEYLNAQVFEAATVFSITFMVGGVAYKTIQDLKIRFPSEEPTVDSKRFTGWYYDQELTNKAEEGAELTEDITLYAGMTSYITNKLDKTTSLFVEDYGGYGDAIWHYVTSKEEIYNLSVYPPSFGYPCTPYAYPAWVKYGSLNEGDILYTYEGSSKIVNAEITSMTHTDGTTTWSGNDLITLTTDGKVMATGKYSGTMTAIANIEITFEDGTTDTDSFRVQLKYTCLVEGTEVTLADRTKKKIEDITYEDELLVWDFDKGCFATAKPLFIKKKQVSEEYNYIKFEDGTELRTVIDHRIFNMDSQKFTYTMDEESTPIGTRVFKEDGTTTRIVERKVVQEKVNYYNIITDYHMNLFANGLLTSCRLNNLYEIKDMKFIKDNRKLVPREEFEEIPDKYFYGLRLAEQPKEINRGNDVKHTKTLAEYVKRLLILEK